DLARRRAIELAKSRSVGIPPDGASSLLLRDPLYHGRRLLEQKCFGCHTHGNPAAIPQDAKDKGADLNDYASYAWIRRLLENPEAPAYTLRAGGRNQTGMREWKEGQEIEDADLEKVARFVATFAAIPADQTVEDWAADPKVKSHPGYQAVVDECLNCHRVGSLGSKSKSRRAPDLFGYGSPRWIARMIRDPNARSLYGHLGKRQPMPAFGSQLSESDIQTIVRYLRNDYLGAPLSPAGEARPSPHGA